MYSGLNPTSVSYGPAKTIVGYLCLVCIPDVSKTFSFCNIFFFHDIARTKEMPNSYTYYIIRSKQLNSSNSHGV